MAAPFTHKNDNSLVLRYKQLVANISILEAENSQLLHNISTLEAAEHELIPQLRSLQESVSTLNQETLRLRLERESALENCKKAGADLENTVSYCRSQTREMKFQLSRLEVKKLGVEFE